MFRTRARNRKPVLALMLIAIATAVLSISGAVVERGTGYPQLVSVQPLPELGGEMCLPSELVSASQQLPPESLFALMQQSPPSRASTSNAQRVVIDRAPIRKIKDAYPWFSGVAVDPIRNEIVVNDENLFQIMTYDRTANTPPTASFTEPKRVIAGRDSIIDFQCGIYVDPKTGDIYSLSNDVGDVVSVYKYGSQGNTAPDHILHTGRGYGLAVDEDRQELPGGDRSWEAPGFHPYRGIWSINDRGAVPPRWKIGGDKSTLLRPRGVVLIPRSKELVVADMRQNAIFSYFFPEIFN